MTEHEAGSKEKTTTTTTPTSHREPLRQRSPDGNTTAKNNNKLSWVEVLLRALSLSLLWNGWCKLWRRPKIEAPKQAMRHGRLIVLLSMTTHFIPMIVAGAIMGLNLRGYYIGSELSGPNINNDVKLSGLQFASKLHELLMQASLSFVIVSFLRHELVRGHGIPFGAIFGSVQFSNPTYLWSKEFVGTLKARFQSKVTKWGLITLIIVGSMLFLVVGPSTAIAMRPQLGNWPAGGTYFYLNATKDQLWPSTLDASNTLPPFTRPWGVIADSLLPFWPGLDPGTSFPDTYNLPSNSSMKTLYTRQTVGIFAAPWTTATTQMSNLADVMTEIGALWINAAFVAESVPGRRYSTRFRFRKDVFWTVKDIYRPLTRVQCWNPVHPTEQDIDKGRLYVPNADTFCPPDQSNMGMSFNDTSQFQQILANYNSSSSDSPVLEFVDLPTDVFGENTIGAFISFPPSWPGGQSLVTCAVDARCKEPALIKGSRSAVKVASGHSNIDDEYADRGACGSYHTGSKQTGSRIKVTKEWANQLNPNIDDSNRTAIHEILGSIPTAQTYRWKDGVGFVAPLIESVLSVLITSGLASTAYNAVPQGLLKGCTTDLCTGTCADGDGAWCKAIMPTTSEFSHGSNAYTLPPSADLTTMTQFRVLIDINGYAYYWRNTTVLLSCIVLGIYILTALTHIFFSFLTGLSSQSWDTIAEIVALAMQSQPTARLLTSTSAGIATTTVFKHFVRVGKTGDGSGHLEFIFEDEDDDGNGNEDIVVPVVVNEFYE